MRREAPRDAAARRRYARERGAAAAGVGRRRRRLPALRRRCSMSFRYALMRVPPAGAADDRLRFDGRRRTRRQSTVRCQRCRTGPDCGARRSGDTCRQEIETRAINK